MQYTDGRGDPIEEPQKIMKVPSKERLATITRESPPHLDTKEETPGESPSTPLKRSNSYHESE